MELHFYPGSKMLIVKEVVSGTEVELGRFNAVGGPVNLGSDPRMQEIPTTAGNYIIDSVSPYSTPTWSSSKIKWGTELRDMPDKGSPDVWYKLRSGKWGSVLKDTKITRNQIIKWNEELYNIPKTVPKKWVFNDFGPLAIRYFIDKNNNKTLDKSIGEKLSGEMIHTTPINEAQYTKGNPVTLGESHGCIHIRPQDRVILQGMNAFESGTPFIVHHYDEKI